MLSCISPYALLRASKPQKPSTVASQYDLFSLAQTGSAFAQASMQSHEKTAADMPAPVLQTPSTPVQRTHYISDIHARHTKASRHAPQSSSAL